MSEQSLVSSNLSENLSAPHIFLSPYHHKHPHSQKNQKLEVMTPQISVWYKFSLCQQLNIFTYIADIRAVTMVGARHTGHFFRTLQPIILQSVQSDHLKNESCLFLELNNSTELFLSVLVTCPVHDIRNRFSKPPHSRLQPRLLPLQFQTGWHVQRLVTCHNPSTGRQFVLPGLCNSHQDV